MDGLPYIPSELLEPHFMRIIGLMFEMVENGSMSAEVMLERMHGLDWLAIGAEATHASLAMTQDIARCEDYIEHRTSKKPMNLDKLAYEFTKLQSKVWEAYRDKNWAILEPTFKEVEAGIARVRECLKRSQEESCNT